jgi:Right handed beta helix region
VSAPPTELIANQSIPVSSTALTTLTKELKAGETTMEVGASAPAVFQAAESQFRVVVGSEIIIIEASSSSTTKWKILERKAEQSSEAAHAIGASIFPCLTVGALKNWQAVVSGVQNARLYCVADGVTDDSANFLKMLEAGKDILVPGGTTVLLNHVEFPANMPRIRIGGTGTLKWAAGAIGGSEQMLRIPEESMGLTFEDLTLDGSQAGFMGTAIEGVTETTETKNVDFIEGGLWIGAEVAIYEMGTTEAQTKGTVESFTSSSIKWTKALSVKISGPVLMYVAPNILTVRGARHVFQNVAILNPPGRGYYLIGGRALLTTSAEAKEGSNKLTFAGEATKYRAGYDVEIMQSGHATTLSEEFAKGGLVLKVASSTGFVSGQKIILSANHLERYEEVHVQDVLKAGEILLTAPCEKAHSSGDAIWIPKTEINVVKEVKSSTEVLLRGPLWLTYPTGAIVKMSECQHVEVHGGSIVGTGLAGYVELSADLSSVPTDCKIDDVDIDDTGWAGIALAGNRMEVSNCHIRRPGWVNPHQDGITFYGEVEPEDVLITGGEILGSNNHGIHGSGHRIHIVGVKIVKANQTGILLEGSKPDCFFGAIIENCEIVKAGNASEFGGPSQENQSAIVLRGYSDVQIAGNLIDSAHLHGIVVTANKEGSYRRLCKQVALEGNEIQTPGESGIVLEDVVGVVSGGRILEPGLWSIHIGDSGELAGYKTKPQRLVVVSGVAIDTYPALEHSEGAAISNGGKYTTLNLGSNSFINTPAEVPLLIDAASARVEPLVNRIAPQQHDKNMGASGLGRIGISSTISPAYGVDEIEVLNEGTIKTVNNNHIGRRLTLVFRGVGTGAKLEAGEKIILKEAYEAKAAGHTLTLLGDGATWYEIGRS